MRSCSAKIVPFRRSLINLSSTIHAWLFLLTRKPDRTSDLNQYFSVRKFCEETLKALLRKCTFIRLRYRSRLYDFTRRLSLAIRNGFSRTSVARNSVTVTAFSNGLRFYWRNEVTHTWNQPLLRRMRLIYGAKRFNYIWLTYPLLLSP